MFRKNVELGPPLRVSPWRKIAIGTWKTAGDPSVYGSLEFDVAPALKYLAAEEAKSGVHLTLTHFVGWAIAKTMRAHPEINCILRFGQLYPRKNIDIFYQVASDMKGEDLSGMTVRKADQKSVVEIAREMQERVALIRSRQDKTFAQVKGAMGLLPGMFAHLALTLTSFITFTLNLWAPFLGPRDPFGSCMVTSIGSLGLDTAFAPLVPYSRVPILIAVGAIQDAAIVREGRVEACKQVRLCATFDHRLIDGVHAANMVKTLRAIFANPGA